MRLNRTYQEESQSYTERHTRGPENVRIDNGILCFAPGGRFCHHIVTVRRLVSSAVALLRIHVAVWFIAQAHCGECFSSGLNVPGGCSDCLFVAGEAEYGLSLRKMLETKDDVSSQDLKSEL